MKDPVTKIIEGLDPLVVAGSLIEGTYTEEGDCPFCDEGISYKIHSLKADWDQPAESDIEVTDACDCYIGDEASTIPAKEFWGKVNRPDLQKEMKQYELDPDNMDDVIEAFEDHFKTNEDSDIGIKNFFLDIDYIKEADHIDMYNSKDPVTEGSPIFGKEPRFERDLAYKGRSGKSSGNTRTVTYQAACPFDPSDGGVKFTLEEEITPGSGYGSFMEVVEKCPHYFAEGERSNDAEQADLFWKHADNPELREYLKSGGVNTKSLADLYGDSDGLGMLAGLIERSPLESEDGKEAYVDVWFADFDNIGEMHPGKDKSYSM